MGVQGSEKSKIIMFEPLSVFEKGLNLRGFGGRLKDRRPLLESRSSFLLLASLPNFSMTF